MAYTKTHAELLNSAEALLHQAGRMTATSREPQHSATQERVRTLCAKAQIFVNRAATTHTWFGRKISAADRERAMALGVAIAALAPPPTETMTIYEAAALLGVGNERVNRYVIEGRLPATKFGYQWRLQTADVLAFRRQPTGKPSRKR